MPVLPSYVETTQLICTANQLTRIYMGATLAFSELIVVKFTLHQTQLHLR